MEPSDGGVKLVGHGRGLLPVAPHTQKAQLEASGFASLQGSPPKLLYGASVRVCLANKHLLKGREGVWGSNPAPAPAGLGNSPPEAGPAK